SARMACRSALPGLDMVNPAHLQCHQCRHLRTLAAGRQWHLHRFVQDGIRNRLVSVGRYRSRDDRSTRRVRRPETPLSATTSSMLKPVSKLAFDGLLTGAVTRSPEEVP